MTPLERILARVVVAETGCWEWPGAKYPTGYGEIRVPGLGNRATHRVTYEGMVGPIPDGLHVDHLCRNRACCNPEHLEPVTQAENIRRGARGPGYSLLVSHCKRGHEFTEANTYTAPNGARSCKACNRLRSTEHARKHREDTGEWASTTLRRTKRATGGPCPGGDR